MKQIIVYFDGGLGNQMSQYAMYKLLSYLYPNRRILANIDIFKGHRIHNGFELLTVFPHTHLKMETRFDSLIARRNNTEEVVQTYQSGYPIDERLYRLEKKTYRIKGTWHNFDYSCIMPELRKDFQFRKLPTDMVKIREEIMSTNSVSIHVRKGDYTQLGLDILSIDWYKKAIDIIKQRIDNAVFFVFSDENIQSFFKDVDGDFRFIAGNSGKRAYIDMQLMSMCKHNIIANSTFSYWAAILNTNPDKIVIRPYMHTQTRKTWSVDNWILL